MYMNLDKEYVSINTIYDSQKKYRSTDLGKKAIKRSNERQLLKRMHNIKKSYGGGFLPTCVECGTKEFEVLTINKDVVMCYNCKYRRVKIFSEEELCL